MPNPLLGQIYVYVVIIAYFDEKIKIEGRQGDIACLFYSINEPCTLCTGLVFLHRLEIDEVIIDGECGVGVEELLEVFLPVFGLVFEQVQVLFFEVLAQRLRVF